jgi:hypothetical protein
MPEAKEEEIDEVSITRLRVRLSTGRGSPIVDSMT